MTSESEIDKCRLRITYEVSVVENTKSGRKYKDRMIVLIGDDWYKSYGEGLWKGNKLVALSDYDPDNKLYMREKGYEEILPHAVYRNQKTKDVINRGIFPKLKKIIFRYDEIQPEFNLWNFLI